jgi:hypothetical protein
MFLALTMPRDKLSPLTPRADLGPLKDGLEQAAALTNAAVEQMSAAFQGLADNGLGTVAAAMQEISTQSAQIGAALAEAAQQSTAAMDRSVEALLQRSPQFDSFFAHLNRAFAPVVTSLVLGTQTVGQAFSRLSATMVAEFAVGMEKMVMNFIAGQLKMLIFHQAVKDAELAADEEADATERGISLASTLREITNQAAQAAARAYAWGASWGGPPAGALMAALAFAGVEAFGALASAAGGWERVPQNQLAMVHQDEMILPPSFAQGLRNVIAGASSSLSVARFPFPVNARAGNGGRETGNGVGSSPLALAPNHYTIQALDGASAAAVLRQHGNIVGDIALAKVKRWARDAGLI